MSYVQYTDRAAQAKNAMAKTATVSAATPSGDTRNAAISAMSSDPKMTPNMAARYIASRGDVNA